jgi:TonB-dependent SusC/RagA subfamily outer membrane receptor
MRTPLCRLVLLAALVGCSGRSASREQPIPDSALTSEELSRQTYSRVEEMIQARVPGVQVSRQANGEYSIRIRGTSSISGSNEPLVVIDGMPVQEGGNNAALASMNPADVARIEVLRDAQSTSFYGMRGANGVIVITTKRQH